MADLFPDGRAILIDKLPIPKQILLGWVIAQGRVRRHEIIPQRFHLGQCQVSRHCILGEFVPLGHKKSPPFGGRVVFELLPKNLLGLRPIFSKLLSNLFNFLPS